MQIEHMKHCQRCGVPYDWRRSASRSLKMTYCGSLCERADLGFTIEALLATGRTPATAPAPIAAQLPEPALPKAA